MWKNFSFKTQLILILLIPISGLIYFTFSNLETTYQRHFRIKNSFENINKIADFSEGITLINNERALNEYSKFDDDKNLELKNTIQETSQWISNFNSSDTVVLKNLQKAQIILNEIHNNIGKSEISSLKTFNDYSSIIFILNNLIEREIANCDNVKLAKYSRIYKCYVDSKSAANLTRCIVVDKLLDDSINSELLGYYENVKNLDENADFKLEDLNVDNINNEIMDFKKSKKYQSFLDVSESILKNKTKLSPDAWWNQATEVNEKLKKIKTEKLAQINQIAAEEKKANLITTTTSIIVLCLLLLITTFLVYNLIKNTSKALKQISKSIQKIASGKIEVQNSIAGNTEFDSIRTSMDSLITGIKEQIDLSAKISSGNFGDTITLRSDSDTLNESLNNMSFVLKKFQDEEKKNNKLRQNVIEVNEVTIQSKNIHDFGSNICNTLVNQTNGCQATFYVLDYTEEKDNLIKIGSHADDENTPQTIKIGEGLLGEAVKTNQQKCLNNLSKEYSFVASSLGKSNIYNVLITPISYKNSVIGVIEIGSLKNFSIEEINLLDTIKDSIGNATAVFIRNEELKISLAEINQKNSILQVQEEELRQNNEELNRQTFLLQKSEEELKNQTAELEQTNEYLEEKGKELENKNNALLIAQEELNIKSAEIAQSSKYKSEFLANMSHELRTPLNSILILSDLLKENNGGNLTSSQIDNLSVINTSGKDLLELINDILDISKIEAGKVEIYPENTLTERIFSDMDGLFRAQMEKKGIEFESIITEECPTEIFNDIGKLEQILKNFLSNALKFTPNDGKVVMTFDAPDGKQEFVSSSLSLLSKDEIVSIKIKDSGIGISDENKKKLFQSFQQADSSTSRKYGGTGLGLAICKQLAELLGGEVFFESQLNHGSTFGVFIPIKYNSIIIEEQNSITPEKTEKEEEEYKIETEYPKSNEVIIDLAANIDDDRNITDIDDKTILIIEDDQSFAEVLLQVAHNNGFKAIIAHQGEIGFQYAKKYNPKAIILDMKLPGIDGWTVLKWLKEDKDLQHIPVHVMSGMDREKLAKEMGAFDFMVKPITPEKLKKAFQSIDEEINKIFKKVLVLEDDKNLNFSIKQLIHSSDTNIICLQAYSRSEAETILKHDDIDCAIIDLGLPDSDNIKAVSELKEISKNKKIKIIINTGKSLSDEEQLELEKNADSIIVKTANATQRLKDELLLFLNKIESSESSEYKSAPNLSGGEILKDKNILVVDDDIRNIYALSAALTGKGANILTAFNGIEALNTLENNSTIDIVLMDIMMPEMDGFEATQKIRENPKWKNLPIIALTAKAMKGDRDKILDAGASDYQSKPLDIQKLISLISIWIYK